MEDAGLAFTVLTPSNLSHQLIGDRQRISQVLINLLGNAIKFTEKGTIFLKVWLGEKQIHFRVVDSGIGMSPEVLERLFQRFEQADSSISRRFGGSGLGLYISYSLARIMGGDIEVESSEGKGSSFQLSLPYRQSDLPVEELEINNSGHMVHHHTHFSGDILVAEDMPELQLLERRILEGMGLNVVVASNGKEAIDQANSQPFDLILMDMQMPEVDGIKATEQLRLMGNQTPIIALTANVMQKHRNAFHLAGCNGFLEKPINKSALREILQQFLPAAEEK